MELVLNIVRRMVKPWLSLMLLLQPFFNRSSMQFKLLSITARNKMVLPFAPVASTLAPVQKTKNKKSNTYRYLIGWCYSLLFMAMPLPCVQLQLITCCRFPLKPTSPLPLNHIDNALLTIWNTLVISLNHPRYLHVIDQVLRYPWWLWKWSRIKKVLGNTKERTLFIMYYRFYLKIAVYRITLVHVHINVLQYKQSRTRTDEWLCNLLIVVIHCRHQRGVTVRVLYFQIARS